MHVATLAGQDFRNYERLAVELAGGLNVVVGRNAQGKTNLLEAIYCLTGLDSPRSPDAAMVRDGAERALLHAEVVARGRKVRLDLEFAQGRAARALVNRTPVPGTRSLGDFFTAVFFGPDDPWLVKGAPDNRRRFVDELVVKLRPARHALRRDWERVLKQRNALLRSAPRGPHAGSALATLGTWDESLCLAGGRLASARLEALAALAPYAAKRYEAVAGGGRLDFGYQSSWLPEDLSRSALGSGVADEDEIRQALAAAVAEMRPKELERGMSLAGPQRDDIVLWLQARDDSVPRDARTYASQGDQRTVALAAKLGEHDVLAESLGDTPVLLLDDVFSELDPKRRAWLTEAVQDCGQTVVSAAEPTVLDDSGAQRAFEIEAGRVRIRE